MPSKNDACPLRMRLLGSFVVDVDGAQLPPMRSRKEHWLLALLVLHKGAAVSRDWLAQTLWPYPEYSQDLARGYLRRALWQLGKGLGEQANRIQRPSAHAIAFDLGGADIDVPAFDDAVARGDHASLEEAIGLYRGELLEECTEEWINLEREKRVQAFRQALSAAAETSLSSGDPKAAVGYYRKAVLVDFFWETAQRGLLKALAATGDYNAASQAYYDFHKRLSKELGRAPDPATIEVFHEIREALRAASRRDTQISPDSTDGPDAASPQSSSGYGKLPCYFTDLVGREAELLEIASRLQRRRLVTLTGPGGIGKTRLAVRAAGDLQGLFSDGVCFVDLSGVPPHLVAHAVASALAIAAKSQPGKVTDVTSHLSTKSLLVVLDNCEHAISACSEIVREVLAACPNVRFVATSRQTLGLSGETAWCVPSLAFPEMNTLLENENDPIPAAMAFPAIRLFVQAASDVQLFFELTAENNEPIVRICKRLDGIPLAIVLAAAQLRIMSPFELLERIEDRFRLLDVGRSDTPPRHRTLRTTILWSWDTLDDAEREFLAQLSVFRGSFTLSAAQAICSRAQAVNDSGDDPGNTDALLWLERLVDRSLVTVEFTSGRTRYRMLEPIREFSQDQRGSVLDSSTVEALHNRHAAWYLTSVEPTDDVLTGPEQAHWLEEFEKDHDNVRAALQWALTAGDGETALRLAGAFWRFWYLRGYLHEGAGWLEQALENSQGADPRHRIRALSGAGNIAHVWGDYEKARSYYQQALDLRRELKDTRGIAASLGSLGNIARQEQNLPEAWNLLEQSLELFRSVEDLRGAALTLGNLAIVAFESGDFNTAADLHQQGIEKLREMGDVHNVALGLSNMSHTLLSCEETDRIYPLLEESLTLNEGLQSKRGIARCLTVFASLAIKQDRMRSAALLIGAQDELRENIQFPLPPAAQAEHLLNCQSVRDALGEAAYQSLYSSGRAMTLQEAIAYARSQSKDRVTDCS
jgi:predicted ATPase/DNA-binding SARP family transcriptional activator